MNLFPRIPVVYRPRISPVWVGRFSFVFPVALALVFGALFAAGPAWAADADRVVMTKSLGGMPPEAAASIRPLRPENLSDTMEFEVALQMHDYPKLIDRLTRGDKVAPDDLEQNYLPSAADYEAVREWLVSEGFTITSLDSCRLVVFAKGTLAQLQQSFQMQMAKVTVGGVEYSTAQTNPSLPAKIAGACVGVNGLQPYLHPHSHMIKHAGGGFSAALAGGTYSVSQILGAYDAANLGVNGNGETIAILIDSVPLNSDLTAFWTANNIPQKLANIHPVNVNGSLPTDQEGEATLDVSWSSGVAPAAAIRIYVTGDLAFTSIDKALARIASDLPSQQSVHQLSISLGLGETYLQGTSEFTTESGYFATITARNVSTFVSSGDAGSNPDTTGHNDPILHPGPLQVEYESSDPSVTAVGGTTLELNALGAVTSEIGWTDGGGGISQVFSRPTWQVGAGVPTGNKRCVPDVSLVADPVPGAFLVYQGAPVEIGGTSWSTPTWAGFCALINQARRNNDRPPLGFLNPQIYPLLGTGNFRDITSGNNGQYNAGTGYDLVTGLGVPDVGNLLQTLASTPTTDPLVTNFTPSFGPATITVTITGANLGSTTNVEFNGLDAASFNVVSPTQVTAVVPNGATTGPITVVSSTGSFVTADPFTIISGTPANDNFANAQFIIGPSGSAQGANVNGTIETGEPQILGNIGGHSIWYKWTATSSDVFTFDTFGSSFDTIMAVYTQKPGTAGGVGNLNLVGANDDSGTGVDSAVSFVAQNGTTYFISVDGSNGAVGVVNLDWAENNTAPIIDNFSPATGTPGTQVTINGGNFSTLSTVTFAGTSGPITASFTSVSATQFTTTVPVGAITGPITVILTNSLSGASQSPFTVITPPANDNFANATPLTDPSGTVTGTNVGATKEPGEPNHAGNAGGHSVWYTWTAADTGNVTFNTFGSSFNTLLAAYTGTAVNALTLVAANDNIGTNATSMISFPTIQGQTYAIAVDGAGGLTGGVTLNWASDIAGPQVASFTPTSGGPGAIITIIGSGFSSATSVLFNTTSASYGINSDTQITATVPTGAATGPISVVGIGGTGISTSDFTVSAAPANDNFVSAFTINGTGGVVGSNVGATKEAGEPNHAGNPGGSSVWWNWTAPSTADYSISTLGSNFNTLLAVYTGSAVSSLTPVVSNDDDPNGGVTSLVLLHAIAGTQYRIAVDGFNGASGAITLSIVPAATGQILYSTAFEPTEGFSATLPLAGQNSWAISGNGANGILGNLFAGLGQQAFLGGSLPKNNGTQVTSVWHTVNYTPAAGDLINFQVLFQVLPSTNGFLDDFSWAAYNITGTKLFAVHFDNSDFSVGVELDDGNGVRSTGIIFDNQTIYTLSVNMDFGNNRWTASLNGTLISTAQPITTASSALTIGYVAAGWRIEGAQPGDNSMVFDNYSVANTGNRAPQILLSPQSQTVVAGNSVTFSVVASGSAPLTYAWQKNNSPYLGPGANTPSITINDVQQSDQGNYLVIVSNDGGARSASSFPAALTVTLPNEPNLTPYKPPGWSDRIVVSTLPTSRTDSGSILSIQTAYVSWAVINSGSETAPASVLNPIQNILYVDGVPMQTFNRTTNIDPGPSNFIDNLTGAQNNQAFSIGMLSAGTHRIMIVADTTNVVQEYDEDDNSYTKTIFVSNPAGYDTVAAAVAPANSGTITGTGAFLGGTKVTLTATPAANFKFVSWSNASGVVSTKPVYTFVVKENVDLIANFVSTGSSAPPAITVSVPTTAPSFATLVNSLNLAGTASSGAGVKDITWQNLSLPVNTRGASGKASGTGSWKAAKVPLQPGNNMLAFTVHDGAGQQAAATIAVSTVASANFVGSYSGLITNGAPPSYVGFGQFVVTPTGSFTGTISFNGIRIPLMGVFSSDGTFSTQVTQKTNIYTISLTISPGNVPDISGTVNSSAIIAVRPAFNKKTNPWKQSPTYTLVLQPTVNGSTLPAGTGFGVVSVNSSGHVIVAGKLADGAAFTAGEDLPPSLVMPFFAPVYGGKGYVAGPVSFANGGAPQISGVADWFKPTSAPGSPYVLSIQTRLTVDGDVFAAPGKGGTVFSTATRQVTLSGDGLPQPILDTVALGSGGIFSVSGTNMGSLKLKVNPKSGLLQGSVIYTPTGKAVAIDGIVLQGENIGAGFFLAPTTSGAPAGGVFQLAAP